MTERCYRRWKRVNKLCKLVSVKVLYKGLKRVIGDKKKCAINDGNVVID